MNLGVIGMDDAGGEVDIRGGHGDGVADQVDTLVRVAARAGAKVVLVGDPAQTGVVNGPGGMLAALADAGHGVDLDTVHRFAAAWEAEASLGLRRGDPGILTVYQEHGRVHACTDSDAAVAAVHARWAAERGQGRQVLMMARTRVEVDLLNVAARATELAAGDVRGPVARFGERDWQPGDLLRARRNERRLPVGTDGHVRNGDRYRVVSVDPAGLQVEHLDRGGSAFLPADYVSVHAEYGWASTITAAQGATVDVAAVLVRPGIDREHLYVAMTRGREANHAYITPDPAGEADHHGAPAPGRGDATRDERALQVLAEALARCGAQDAAHTVRDNARARAAEAARRAAEVAARRAREPLVPADHTQRVELLALRQDQHTQLARDQQAHREAAAAARHTLAGTSRLRPGRRRELVGTITAHEQAVQAAFGRSSDLSREVEALTRQVATDARTRAAEQRRPRPARGTGDSGQCYLAPAHPIELGTGVPSRSRQAIERMAEEFRQTDLARRREDHHTIDVARDGARTIGY